MPTPREQSIGDPFLLIEPHLHSAPQLDYPVDVGYLSRTEDEGEEAFRITVEGINEVQRRPQL
jgi:hypothetical protein